MPSSSQAFPRRPKVIFVILLSVSLLLLFKPQSTNAQAPQQFSFQGVARDASGKILANKSVSLGHFIHKGSTNGTIVFSETQTTTTNSNGVFNISIGSVANLSVVQWESDAYFLQTLMLYDGLPNAVDLGTVQLFSVPYALLSQNAIHSLNSDKSKSSEKWVEDSPIVQTGSPQSGDLPDVGAGIRLIWHPKKASLRSGVNANNSWLDANIGENSFATGEGTKASGKNSMSTGLNTQATGLESLATGNQTTASGENSTSLGGLTTASGENSVAMGYQSQALADNSFAMGVGSQAKANGSLTVGTFNNINDVPGVDRIFQVGNGATGASRSNAMTVLRNGNIGFGNNSVNPEYLLDIGGRIRMRHSGSTSGIHFNNSQNVPEGFVGMINDNEIGFFIGGAWRFVVNKSGTVYANEFFTTSDKNLKSDLKTIDNSLSNLKMLNGYNYHWKDKKNDKSLQTGLIAQEVEVYFPNLVSTKEDGYKAVNYIGLIPHLIEAVKDLDKKTEEIAALKKELASIQELNKKLSALEASVKELLAGQATTSTQTTK